MRFLNEIMTRCDGKTHEDESSNFAKFEKTMTEIFEKSYEEEEDVNLDKASKKKDENPINKDKDKPK